MRGAIFTSFIARFLAGRSNFLGRASFPGVWVVTLVCSSACFQDTQSVSDILASEETMISTEGMDEETEGLGSETAGESTEPDQDGGKMQDTASDTPSKVDRCSGQARPRGRRILGVDLLNSPEADDFDINVEKADELGIDFIALHAAWTLFEPEPEVYEDPDRTLTILSALAEVEDLQISLTLRPIDLTGKTVPFDLNVHRFNSEEMIDRFTTLVDFLLEILPPEQLVSLQIGNEIDGFDASGEHPEFWSDYGEFLYAVTEYIHFVYPGIQVGFTGTYAGLTEGPLADAGVWKAYASVVDVVGITYYPLNSQFQVKKSDDPWEALAKVSSTFPDRRILLQEVGFPSASQNGSSLEKQADFFCNFFQAWDEYSEQIGAANIVRMHDVPDEEARLLAGPYGIDNPAFLAYLQSLGLRSWPGEGEDKPAFEVVAEQADLRGW